MYDTYCTIVDERENIMKKLLLVMVLLFAGCTNEVKLNKYQNVSLSDSFNTILQLVGYTENKEQFNEYYSYAVDRFAELDKLYDLYDIHPGINNVALINSLAGTNKPVVVEQILFDLLKLSKEMYELTDGTLDITMGKLIAVWHQYREAATLTNNIGPIPSQEELNEAASYRGMEYLELNEETNEVMITKKGVSIDLGAVAKGYAAETIASELQAMGLTCGIVNAGGNTRVIGTKENNLEFKSQLNHPNGGLFDSFSIDIPKDASLVTSGDYNQFFMDEDHNSYHHIIDPKTLYPSDYARSVSVITTNGYIADAVSTALFSMSYDDGIILVKELQKTNDLDVMWTFDIDEAVDMTGGEVIEDQYIIMTDGFKEEIKPLG